MAKRRVVIPDGMERFYEQFHFAPAFRRGKHVFCSGQLGNQPDGKLDPDPAVQITTAFENVFRDVAAEFDVPWIEFFMDGVALNEELMQADGIHPNAAAQPILLDNAWPIIEEALQE